MGECLITRRGGETYKLPILDANYPENVTAKVIKGETTSATFIAVIAEPGNPAIYTYQWYVDGVAVEGATEASFTKDDLAETGTHTVYCMVTNKKGTVTTRIATLDVNQNRTPVLASNYPEDVDAIVNDSVTCKAVIETEGNPAEYTYQWYKDGGVIDGATESSYTFEADTVGSMTLYCVVTSAAGSVTSRTATITCTPYYIFKDGSFADGGSYGFKGDDSEDKGELTNGVLHIYDQSSGWASIYTTKKYDFTNQKKLCFRCPTLDHEGSNSIFYFGVADTQADSSYIASYAIAAHTSSAVKTFVVDVSKITGTHYVKFGTVRNEYAHSNIYVNQIYFG